MTATLGFFGAVGTVTGARYLLTAAGRRILVDCGLFQGPRHLRQRNWQPLPFDPGSVDAVVLTHAHPDHSGYLPLLVRQGFAGPVHATAATRELCEIVLRDSGHLQERDAEFANAEGFSRHHPALPLHTEAEAAAALDRISPLAFGRTVELCDGLQLRLLPSGHMLGAAQAELTWDGRTILFSGDLGRWNSSTMADPAPAAAADYLVVESTFGDHRHEGGDPEDRLAAVVARTAARGGTVLVPALAVGRAQTLLFHLHRLKAAGRIPDLPVFVDSPMAVNVGEIYCRHLSEHRLTAAECRAACNAATYVRDPEHSAALERNAMPKVIVAANAMATGGRVLHHLAQLAPDPRNAILLAGFQARGTRGSEIAAGAEAVKVHGRTVPIRAEVAVLHSLSAHMDAAGILRWLSGLETPPRRTFVTHGEPPASAALQQRISDELGWPCEVPGDGQTTELD